MKFLGRVAVVCISAFAMACAIAKSDDFGDLPGTDGGEGGGGDGSVPCTAMCNKMCTDLKTDNANCGVCGKACPSAAMCTAGQCKCPATDGGSAVICGDQCVDTKTDPNNCGGCGLKCGAEGGALTGGGMWTCTNGACDITCGAPNSPCVPFGCFDLKKDNTNCGMCGTDCGGAPCLTGMCCQQNEVDCNGACTNTMTDKNNCGMCGTKCMTTCTMGKCCSAPPKGNCAHLPCAQGAKLGANCDGVGCVAKVCQNDSFCCSTLWDSFCVSEVDTYCAPTYKCAC